MNETQALYSKSSQFGGEQKRLGKSRFVRSMHSLWEMTEEVSLGGLDARIARKTPAGGTPQAALAATQK